MLHNPQKNTLFNAQPDKLFNTVSDIRCRMTEINDQGDHFLNYLVSGNYFDGKEVWINDNRVTRSKYEIILSKNPHLDCENPFGEYFRKKKIRVQGENEIKIAGILTAPEKYQQIVQNYEEAVASLSMKPTAIFSGGPAPKVACILSLLDDQSDQRKTAVKFILDGAEQSNESGSASYEHIHHANALNAEHDNTGLGILICAFKRALLGEPHPDSAIETDYPKVDIWPRGFRLKDVPIFVTNELHGRIQFLKKICGIENDHDKSRLASKFSTQVISFIETKTGRKLRLDNQNPRAIFINFTKKQHLDSIKEHKEIAKTIEIEPKKLSSDEIAYFYGAQTLNNIASADIIYENSCIRHGFDSLCRNIIEDAGGAFLLRKSIRRVFFARCLKTGKAKVCGVEVEDLSNGELELLPCSFLALSLGPTATFNYDTQENIFQNIQRLMGIGCPIPHQTIATGFSAQVLFRIIDHSKFRELPFTGLKQTHFVEVGRSEEFIAVKLTAGGVIGLPVYSRSYAISAIANMLRVLTSDTGLAFYDVVCAWPCSRGVNGTNNGQIVRLSDNAAIRFGEGGTGMSKMGSNAQTLLDLIGLETNLPKEHTMPNSLYHHTIIDRSNQVRSRLRQDI